MGKTCKQDRQSGVKALIAYYESICRNGGKGASTKKVAQLKKSLSLERGQLKKSMLVSKSAFFEVHAKKQVSDDSQVVAKRDEAHEDGEKQKFYEGLLRRALREFVRLREDPLSQLGQGHYVRSIPEDGLEVLCRGSVSSKEISDDRMSKSDLKRFRCAREILESERTYILSLRRLKKCFLDPISFVSQEELNLIAGNMMSILSLSEMFFENLSFRMAYFDPDTTLLGDVLAVFVPLISIYTEYCYRHRERVQTIRRLSAENARFRGVLERGTAASNGQDIYAHCVLPIQRISRYRLLFESLLLATDKTHLDYPNLEKAFNLVRDKISDINRKLAISDQQNNLVLLSFRLDAPVLPDQELLQPWRTLSGEYKIKYLRPSKHNVYSMHSWIHAYLYICNDIFIIAAKSKANATTWDPQDKLRIITTQLLWNSFLSQVAEQRLSRLQIFSHVLQILNPEGSWIIASDEKQQMAQLKECFQTQQKLYLSLHPEKRFERRKTKQSINDDLKLWMAAGFSPNQSFNKNGKKTCDSPVKQKYVTLSKLSNKSSSTNLKKNFNKICGELGKAITRKPSQ